MDNSGAKTLRQEKQDWALAKYSNHNVQAEDSARERNRKNEGSAGGTENNGLELVTLANSRSRHCFYSVVETIACLDVTVFVRETLRANHVFIKIN